MITIKKRMTVHALHLDDQGVRVHLGDGEEGAPYAQRFDISFPIDRKQIAEIAVALSDEGEHADLTIEIGPERKSEITPKTS